jgi:hypothetical protein
VAFLFCKTGGQRSSSSLCPTKDSRIAPAASADAQIILIPKPLRIAMNADQESGGGA